MEQDSEYQQIKHQNPVYYVSAADLQQYLHTLSIKDRTELQDLIQNHAHIESANKGSEKFYRSKDRTLKEIDFIISKSKEKRLHESSFVQSSISETETKTVTKRIGSLMVNSYNYKSVIENVCFLKKIDAYPFEVSIKAHSQQMQHQKAVQMIIVSKCRGMRKVYFIFEQFHELVALQSLVDIEWKLETLNTIRSNFIQQKKRMVKVPYEGRELFFFNRVDPHSWNLFINTINKEPLASSIILMKFSLFPQLNANYNKFTTTPRIAFAQSSFYLPNFSISSVLKYDSEIEFGFTHDLASRVLNNNSRQFVYKNKIVLDCITSYNVLFCEEKGMTQMKVALPQQSSQKEYIYFTYYNKFMQIIHQQKRVILIEKQIPQEVSNKLFRGSLNDLIGLAIFNQIPFFSFYQSLSQIANVSIDSLKRVKTQDVNKLLFYQHKFSQKHYKVTFSVDRDIEEVIEMCSPTQTVKFDNAALLAKIGKIKSSQIIKKYRQKGKGCLNSKLSYCTSFVEKCIEDMIKEGTLKM